MNQRVQLFFWVILLLVGVSFVSPEVAEETPAAFQAAAIALMDADDDDDPDRSRAATLGAPAHFPLLPLALFLTGLPLFGRLQPPTQSTTAQFLLLSLRSPRSPTAN